MGGTVETYRPDLRLADSSKAQVQELSRLSVRQLDAALGVETDTSVIGEVVRTHWREAPRSLEQTKVGVRCRRWSTQELTNEPRQRRAQRLGLGRARGRLVREGLCHAVCQNGNETSGLAGRQPESPGAHVALPERENHGGIARVG
jgi:hypothetical protein